MPTILAGFPVRVAFRIAKEGESCWWGDWETDKDLLLSVARVRDGEGGPVFEEMDIECITWDCDGNRIDCSDRAIFRQPCRAWKPYLLRIKTRGWDDGVYQVSVTALDGSIPPQVDHFRIWNWNW